MAVKVPIGVPMLIKTCGPHWIKGRAMHRNSLFKSTIARVALCSLLLIVSACTSSGIVKVGPDTYSISAYHDYSFTGAKQMAYKEANAYCAQEERLLLTIGTSQQQNRVAGIPTSNFELDFRCLEEDDPELHRPTLKKVPDVVIQQED